ncbi:MAG: hypothetical protein WEE64_06520 [Dehalococcoidia bacterium]
MTVVRPSTQTAPVPAGRRVPGRRFVAIFFTLGSAAAALIVLITVLSVREEGSTDPACREEPDVCAAVEKHVEALNEVLPVDERFEELHITAVSVVEGTAVVRARFEEGGLPVDVTYRLVEQDGGWLIDG